MQHLHDDLDEDSTYAKEALICKMGDDLKKARLDKGLSHEDIIDDLKFNISFLTALEDGNWSEMPGDIYAMGFLRQYAELLDVDVDADIQRIKTNKYELTKPITYPDATISPNKTWGISAILLFFLAMIVANLFESAEQPAKQATEQSAEQSTQIKAANPAEQSLAPLIQKEVPLQDVYSKQHISEAIISHKTANTDAQPLAEAVDIAPLDKPKQTAATQSYGFFAVSDDVWLQVFEVNAAAEPILLREAMLKIKESFSISSQSPLLLTAGNPMALEVTLDGNIIFAQGSLGKDGHILKRFLLKKPSAE